MANEDFANEIAVVSYLPYHDGDGYSWGGGTILTIGKRSIALSPKDGKLADEIARRWNASRAQSEDARKKGE